MPKNFPIATELQVKFCQYLNEQGQVVNPLPEFAQAETLQDLYRQMVLLRLFDTKAINLQRTGKMGTYPSILGQEAYSVAIGHAMEEQDVFVPYYRDHGTQLQRKIAMEEIFSYWGGSEQGNCFAQNKEDFPVCVPIATQCLHAVGIAKAIQYRKQNRAVVVTIGEGGTSKGDFYEALNLAGVWSLPVVFVVNNNQWAISISREKQTQTQTIAQKAFAGGFEGVQVDGNDVIGVKAVVTQALEKARLGQGPTLIEAITYRLGDHTTADDASRYRSKQALAEAWEKEPLLRLRNYLFQQGWWNEVKEKDWQDHCQKEITQAVERYFNLPKSNIASCFEHTYAQISPTLKAQKIVAEKLMGAKS